GARAAFLKHGHDVAQRLADLLGQVVGLELLLGIPGDLSSHEDDAAANGQFAHDAVGVAARGSPVGWLQDIHSFLSLKEKAISGAGRSAEACRFRYAAATQRTRWRAGI